MGNARILRQGAAIDRKAVILTRYEDLPAIEILHRMVSAVVAEFHLNGTCAAGQPQQLMSHANTKNGKFFFE